MCATYRLFSGEEIGELKLLLEKVETAYGDGAAGQFMKGDFYPKATAPIIGQNDQVILGKWGFPLSNSKQVVFNARAETLLQKSMFRNHLSAGRCLIPSTGFYEWDKNGGTKRKCLIRPAEAKLFYMAGIYGVFPWGDGSLVTAYTIITTAPNRQMGKIHNRMPAILPLGRELEWAENRDISKAMNILKPYQEELLFLD